MFGVADISPISSDLAYAMVRIRGEFSETASRVLLRVYHRNKGNYYLSLSLSQKGNVLDRFLLKLLLYVIKFFIVHLLKEYGSGVFATNSAA
jgi:hypothetical protein